MCRTISMIYLVQIGSYCHLNFISKLYTVTLWYYCIIGFYTFQGIQRYKVCKNWTCRVISMEFTRSSLKQRFEFEIWKRIWLGWLELTWLATWQHGTGWYRFGKELLILALGPRSSGQERKGEIGGSSARGFRRWLPVTMTTAILRQSTAAWSMRTTCRRGRRTRRWRRGVRLHPAKEGEGG
jgi:hypothetical protein